MKNCCYLLLSLLCFSSFSYATHNKGGELTYKHLNGLQYELTLTTYTDISSPQYADRPEARVFFGDGTASVQPRIVKEDVESGTRKNKYKFVHTYPQPGYYKAYYQDFFRNEGILNMQNSVNTTFYVESLLPVFETTATCDYNTPGFLSTPIFSAQAGVPFKHNITAIDSPVNAWFSVRDSLSFQLVPCKSGNDTDVQGYFIPNNFSINSLSGEITWNSPDKPGLYAFAVRVNVWRNKKLISYITRDFQLKVSDQFHTSYSFEELDKWNKDSTGNYIYHLHGNDSICESDELNLSFSYADTNSSGIELLSFCETYNTYHGATFITNNQSTKINATFKWRPLFWHPRPAPYVITFRGVSYTGSAYTQTDLTLIVYVDLADCDNEPFDTCASPPPLAANYHTANLYSTLVKPNPFSKSTYITLTAPLLPDRDIAFIVYDRWGRKVREINQLSYPEILFEKENLLTGIYFYEWRHSDRRIATGKLMID